MIESYKTSKKSYNKSIVNRSNGVKRVKKIQTKVLTLNQFFTQNKSIGKIIFSAQSCFFIKDLKVDNLIERVVQSTREIIRNESIKLEQGAHDNLYDIVAKIIESIECQQAEFINYLAFNIMRGGYQNGNFNVEEYLAEILCASLHELKFGKKYFSAAVCFKIQDNFVARLKVCENEIKSHYAGDKVYKVVGLIGILSCMCWLFVDGISNNFEMNFFQIRNAALFLLSYIMYSYGYKFVNFTFNQRRNNFSHLDFPDYKLEEIDIVDFEGRATKKVTYLPNFDCREPGDLLPTYMHDDNNQKENNQVIRQKKTKSLPSLSFEKPSAGSRALTDLAVLWSGEAVWFFDPNSQVFSHQTTEMRSPFFSKSVRFFGFFNAQSLRVQDLDEKDPEWENYEARVKNGTVVSPAGYTGIKQLKPRILADVKIGNDEFKGQLFSWSAKKVKTVNRLLGRNAATVMSSDGIQHKLVDFCWHLPKGPGH